MKYLKTYKIFESNNSDELLDLLRSDLEEIGIKESQIYVSTCVFVCKKDGYPSKTKGIEWDESFYNDNDRALSLSNITTLKAKFSDIYKSNIGLKSYKYKKTPELNKKGVVIFYGPTFNSEVSNGTENTSETIKIFNGLNKLRFNSFGYDYTISTDPLGRRLILIFKMGGFIKNENLEKYPIYETTHEEMMGVYFGVNVIKECDSIIADIKDMVLELSDIGLSTTVGYAPMTLTWVDKTPKIVVEVQGELRLCEFNEDDINSTFERIKDYVRSKGYPTGFGSWEREVNGNNSRKRYKVYQMLIQK